LVDDLELPFDLLDRRHLPGSSRATCASTSISLFLLKE